MTDSDTVDAALKFYADGWKFKQTSLGLEWSPTEALLDDCGNRAREALSAAAPSPRAYMVTPKDGDGDGDDIEIVARAICTAREQNGGPPWEYWEHQSGGKHVLNGFRDDAIAAIRALASNRTGE